MTLTSLFKSKYDLPIVILLFGLALLVEYQEGVTIVEDETLSYRHLVRADYGILS